MISLDIYLKPCDLRDYGQCLALTDRLGSVMEVTPVQCARCMLKGKPDVVFLNKLLLPEFAKQLEYIRLGFYKDYEEIKNLVLKAFWFGFKKEMLSTMIDSFVEHGRITEEDRTDLYQEMDKKRVEGVVDVTKQLATALMGGYSSEEQIQARREVCHGCHALDEDGDEMYREIDEKPYCGKPRAESVHRNPKLSGCGCNLESKWRFRKTHCPLQKWGPV